MILQDKKIKLFTLSANPELAKEIADSIGIKLGDCRVKRFADGEVNVAVNETVRGHHVIVISLHHNSSKNLPEDALHQFNTFRPVSSPVILGVGICLFMVPLFPVTLCPLKNA